MGNVSDKQERRTSVDTVFDYLYEQIVTLGLLPGAKISEAEIASKFGVSRQPVRDAFSRLDNLNLLLIRPQKATEVRKFSLQDIDTARFVRRAVEIEVMHQAVEHWDGSFRDEFEQSLARQEEAYDAADVDTFHTLDYEFHRLLSKAAKADFAFEIISSNKAQVDRLCVLSLTSTDSMAVLIEDHKRMLGGLFSGDKEALNETLRIHLSRLDEAIAKIHREHANFFDD
ncbi:MAG: GntR family transcriptional regulator [Litoreibacter sp.]